MANRLSVAQINAILTLHASEHSNREIGRLLGVHRETVGGVPKRLVIDNLHEALRVVHLDGHIEVSPPDKPEKGEADE